MVKKSSHYKIPGSVILQGVLKILPDLKVKKIFRTLNVIAIYDERTRAGLLCTLVHFLCTQILSHL